MRREKLVFPWSWKAVKDWQVENCVQLFEEGNTIPFISRYRKEKTGGLDDMAVAQIKHWNDVFTDMEKRKDGILSTIADSDTASIVRQERSMDAATTWVVGSAEKHPRLPCAADVCAPRGRGTGSTWTSSGIPMAH